MNRHSRRFALCFSGLASPVLLSLLLFLFNCATEAVTTWWKAKTGGEVGIFGFSCIENSCWVAFFTFQPFTLLPLLMATDSSGHNQKLADVDSSWIDEKEQGGKEQGASSRQRSCSMQRRGGAHGPCPILPGGRGVFNGVIRSAQPG